MTNSNTRLPEASHKITYPRIDRFRVIAALLVVAIHTYPLMSIGSTPDFILTQIFARVAVPFFFMASGFFLLPSFMNDQQDCASAVKSEGKFLKKSLLLYGISILIYLPVNIYAGYFKTDQLLPNIAKDLVFDGTFYHLWYLPASMLGMIIVCFLLRKLSPRSASSIVLLLYLIGLFGDSYYGLAEQIPALKTFYDAIFFFSDYTRNGIFFAPVFLLLGGLLGRNVEETGAVCFDYRYSSRLRFIGLILSATMLLAEGLALHSLGLQRHTSMYFMLLPCMYFLFATLLVPHAPDVANNNGSNEKGLCSSSIGKHLRNISMIVYLIHPLLIIMVRCGAKVVGLESLLIDNSVIHYLAVAGSSCVIAILISLLLEKRRRN